MNIKEMDPIMVVLTGVGAFVLLLLILILAHALGRSQAADHQNVQIHTLRQTEIIPRGGATRVQIVKCLPGAARGAICVRARYPKPLPITRAYIPLDQHNG